MSDISNRDNNSNDDFDRDIDLMMTRRKNRPDAAASRPSPDMQNRAPRTDGVNGQPQAHNRVSYPAGNPTAEHAQNRAGSVNPANVHRPPAKNGADDKARRLSGAPKPRQGDVRRPDASNAVTPHSSAAQGVNINNAHSHAPELHAGQRIKHSPEESVPHINNRPIRPNPIKGKSTDSDPAATRVTEIGKKAVVPADKKDEKGKKAEADKDVGGQLAIGMVRALVYLVVVTVVAAIISIFVINVGNDVFAFVKSDEVIDVEIPENATSADIADILYENGVIKYKSVFKFYGKLKKISDDYVAGEYSVTPMMNYETLYYEFREKPVSGTSWITIPEGYTVDEIIDLMVSYGIGTKEGYVDAINNYDFDYWFVKELKDSGWDQNRFYRLEGYLFPDTYEFYNASSEVTVINKMLSRFDDIYTEAYKNRAAELNMTTDKIVIIASMIEKEAGQSSDYRNVSSVFYNRLNNAGKFSKLESDATVVYAIQHDTGERPKEVTGETIQYQSPYNTYTNDGLPPGAISNPGMNALKYALYPADTKYFYFVSSGDGVTLFASTNAEHENNKAIIKRK